jgi:type II secretory ATPase GspE/PulE/Tfp pilus assembly ATPase PilB-like protein
LNELAADVQALARTAQPVVAVADRLLAGAIEARASDVHVEPEPDVWTIRYRIDGVLQEVARVDRKLVPTLVARYKVLAELPTYVTDVPQDGRIAAARARAPADVRLAVIPTVHGEKAVLRLFDPSERLLALHELEFPEPAARALEQAVLAPRGVVVLTGPAGSGKSTTIHAALRLVQERSKGQRSVVGIEDPVERIVPGITQTQVNPAAGFGFAQALRALLRQDPEVIYVGEIRDAETAAVAIQAGLTGHLVITTLHSGTCAQVVTRLLEMGIEPHLLTSSLSAIFAQRLVRRVCCEGGCAACHGTGYRGRIPIVEVLVPSRATREAILARRDDSAFAPAPGESLADHARALVERRVTTREEVERVLGPV